MADENLSATVLAYALVAVAMSSTLLASGT